MSTDLASEDTNAAAAGRRQLMSGISEAHVALIDRYWRAANYVSVGQIYLLDNRLQQYRRPSPPENVSCCLCALRTITYGYEAVTPTFLPMI